MSGNGVNTFMDFKKMTLPDYMEIFSGDSKNGLKVIDSLLRLISLDQSLAVTAYMASKADSS